MVIHHIIFSRECISKWCSPSDPASFVIKSCQCLGKVIACMYACTSTRIHTYKHTCMYRYFLLESWKWVKCNSILHTHALSLYVHHCAVKCMHITTRSDAHGVVCVHTMELHLTHVYMHVHR